VTTFGGNADGAACAFPFDAYTRTYEACTTEKSSGTSHYDFLWCSTTPSYDDDKKWGKCPGCVGGDSCCKEGICGVNEGDCDRHSDCKEGLICGENNCDGPSFQSTDDCCTDQGCKGGDSCCTDGICGVNEGDCDSDSDCQEGLVCGKDNCVGDTFDSTDDCCKEDPCYVDPCLNGGECFDGDCICPDGFAGDTCETAVVTSSNGDPCVFPWIGYEREHPACTTEKSNPNKHYDYLWCATTSNYDEDGKWGKCPGCVGDDSCCTSSNLCGINEGDCDDHSDCKEGLVCGENNCEGPSFQGGDDCCAEKCTGGDSCCDNGICGVNEGDCDNDSDCKDGLVCGTDNCVGDTFQSSDDCCKLDGCNPDPCQNGGSCSDGVCSCPDGFGGDVCENVVVTTFGGNADGAACAFPFDAYTRTYEACTTEKSSGTSHYDFLWCSTTPSYDDDKKWGKCPGCVGGDSCCKEGICGVNEGDCDRHSDCKEGLVCGEDNCVGDSFQSSDDCCTDQGCKGGDSCCTNGICGVNEGDCDRDSDCKEGLVCGKDNCVGDTFQSSDDCCKLDGCNPDPCLNGGTCSDGVCSCPDNFAGDKCEKAVITTFSGNSKGAPCVFPFEGYNGVTFTECTTKNANGGDYDYLWCATTSSYVADHKWGKCPGCVGGDSCCESDNLCGINEGDCDHHSDCKEGLVCGENNCVGDSFQSSDDCCTDQGCKGGDSCCTDGICGVNEGDCDSHSDCKEGLVCGEDNCVGDSFQSTDDCCTDQGCKGGDSCCKDGICGKNEGDCDRDSDCQEGLTCGKDNCVGDTFQSSDDCCE